MTSRSPRRQHSGRPVIRTARSGSGIPPIPATRSRSASTSEPPSNRYPRALPRRAARRPAHPL